MNSRSFKGKKGEPMKRFWRLNYKYKDTHLLAKQFIPIAEGKIKKLQKVIPCNIRWRMDLELNTDWVRLFGLDPQESSLKTWEWNSNSKHPLMQPLSIVPNSSLKSSDVFPKEGEGPYRFYMA